MLIKSMVKVDQGPVAESERKLAALAHELQGYSDEFFLVVERKWQDHDIHTTFPEPSFEHASFGRSYPLLPDSHRTHLEIHEYLGIAKEPFVATQGPMLEFFTPAFIEYDLQFVLVRERSIGPWLPYLSVKSLDVPLPSTREGVHFVDSAVSPGAALEVIVGNDAVTHYFVEKAKLAQASDFERESLRELAVIDPQEYERRISTRAGAYFSLNPLRRFHLMQRALGGVLVMSAEYGKQLAVEFHEELIHDETELFGRISQLLTGERESDNFKREMKHRLKEAVSLGMHRTRVDKIYEVSPGVKAHVHIDETIRDLCEIYGVPVPDEDAPAVDNKS